MLDRFLRSAFLASAFCVWLLSLVLVAGCVRSGPSGSEPTAPHPSPAAPIGPAKPESPRLELLCFWEPWCAPCRAAIADEKAIAARYPGRLKLHGISRTDDAPTKAKSLGITWPCEVNAAVCRQWNVSAVPTWILLEDGRQAFRSTGAWAPVETAIAKALQ